MNIPLVDLRAQYDELRGQIDAAVRDIIDRSSFIGGPYVEGFERDFATYCRVHYAVGTSSGTSALHLALLACDVGPGDEVITTPHTFTATAEAIFHAGARPVFVDIDMDSYEIDPTQIEDTVTERTKAIIPVHLYGRPAEMDPIMDIANRHGLKVIEDAAQAHGAEYKGQRVGSIGNVACFSFYPAKNLGAYGDGGIVITNNEEIAKEVRILHDHGRREKYEHLLVGYGYRLDALQAAILKVKLAHLDEWNQRRRESAETYCELLNGLDLVLPTEPEHLRSVYHLFVVRTPRRDALRKHLRAKGIHTGIHYPIPLHLQPCFNQLGYSGGDFPNAEKAAEEVLSLPLYPELTEVQIGYIADSVRTFFNRIS